VKPGQWYRADLGKSSVKKQIQGQYLRDRKEKGLHLKEAPQARQIFQ